MFCAVLIRRLKEGASFEDFRKAWEPEPAAEERDYRAVGLHEDQDVRVEVRSVSGR